MKTRNLLLIKTIDELNAHNREVQTVRELSKFYAQINLKVIRE